jgi:hypothetical protein
MYRPGRSRTGRALFATKAIETLKTLAVVNFSGRNRLRAATAVSVAIEQPSFDQVRVSNELRKRGVFVSPSGVRDLATP